MEDVATIYLNQLISRNMIQVKSSKYDVVKDCHMHDLLRDLCQRKAKEEINLEVLMKEEADSHHSIHKPRHRAIYNTERRFPSSTSRNHYLRSLFMIGEYSTRDAPSSYWKSFELLRVLDLGNTVFYHFPKAIGSLTGLRYIKMRHLGTSKLPRSWAKLTNLQVLHLWDAGYHGYIIIDKVILKMKSLRHLCANISSCKVSLSNMKKLQTLTSWYLLEESNVLQIQGMAGVTTLGFDMFQLSDASKLFTHLATLENLVSLTLKHGRMIDMDGLAALHHITKLKLKKFDSLETLTNFPPKLSYLTLSEMLSIKDPMPVLETLPELLFLKMDRVHHGEEIVITRHGFPKLKVLHLNQLISRNMIQVESSKYDVVEGCHMHDLLRDLSQRKAKKEINLEVLMKEDGDSHHSLQKPRHRAMDITDQRRFPSSTSRNHYLRSLFMTGEYSGRDAPSSYWKSFEPLRVLHLGNTKFYYFPKAIGSLTGLRYIKMRYTGFTSKLPRSWAKLTK